MLNKWIIWWFWVDVTTKAQKNHFNLFLQAELRQQLIREGKEPIYQNLPIHERLLIHENSDLAQDQGEEEETGNDSIKLFYKCKSFINYSHDLNIVRLGMLKSLTRDFVSGRINVTSFSSISYYSNVRLISKIELEQNFQSITKMSMLQQTSVPHIKIKFINNWINNILS